MGNLHSQQIERKRSNKFSITMKVLYRGRAQIALLKIGLIKLSVI